MKKHSARVAPLSACNSPVLTLTKVEGNAPDGSGDLRPRGVAISHRPGQGAASSPGAPCRAAAAAAGSFLRGPSTSGAAASAPARPALWVGGGHPSTPQCPPRTRLCPWFGAPQPRLPRGVARLVEAGEAR